MKNISFIIILVFHFCFSQEKVQQNTYLHFDNTSEKTYSVEVNGKIITERFYSKAIRKNGDITFYINKEMFFFNEKKADTCKIKHLKTSKLKTLKEEVNKINPLYPYKVFPNLYLVERINDSLIVKYKVKWEYYIE